GHHGPHGRVHWQGRDLGAGAQLQGRHDAGEADLGHEARNAAAGAARADAAGVRWLIADCGLVIAKPQSVLETAPCHLPFRGWTRSWSTRHSSRVFTTG